MIWSKNDSPQVAFVKVVKRYFAKAKTKSLPDIAVVQIVQFLEYAGVDVLNVISKKFVHYSSGKNRCVLNPFFGCTVIATDGSVSLQATYWLDQIALHTASYCKRNRGLSLLSVSKEVRRQMRAVPVKLIAMPLSK